MPERAGVANGDGCRWRSFDEAIYDKPGAREARGVIFMKRKGRLTTPSVPEKRRQTYDVASVRQVFPLDELADPAADKVPDDGDADADHEHVEAGPEGAAAGEHRSRGTNQEVRQHG